MCTYNVTFQPFLEIELTTFLFEQNVSGGCRLRAQRELNLIQALFVPYKHNIICQQGVAHAVKRVLFAGKKRKSFEITSPVICHFPL